MWTDKQSSSKSNAHSPTTREIFAFLVLHLLGETQTVQDPAGTSFSLENEERDYNAMDIDSFSILCPPRDHPAVRRCQVAALGILKIQGNNNNRLE